MQNISRMERIVLLLGDLVVLFGSLILTLIVRYWGDLSYAYIQDHIPPFVILFVCSILAFFIAGLYDQHTVFFKKKLPNIILRVQVVNAIIAIALFYFVPFFTITPKINLFLYIITSSLCMVLWRLYGFSVFTIRSKNKAVIIGEGKEVDEIAEEINNNARYPITITKISSLSVIDDSVKTIILENSLVHSKELYPLILKGVQCFELYNVYEQIFDRIPLSLVNESWLIRNISVTRRPVYSFIKRCFDLLVALILGSISLIVYPFVYIAIKLEDGGSIFIIQERIGKNDKTIKIPKFRSMSRNDQGEYGTGQKNYVTKVGAFIRRVRIDELPQLWSVIRGDISLIGPRPELPALVQQYEEVIPYYNLRHIVEPGLSGWAQIYHEQHPHHHIALEETRDKLSYDLFYIKHRSLALELTIALRTIRTLLSKSGI